MLAPKQMTFAMEQVGPQGSTPLVMVCTQGKEEEVRALVAAKADPNLEAYAFDDDDENAHANEHYSAWKKRRTPLMAAASQGHVNVAKILLELGANLMQGKSDTAATALAIASQEGRINCVSLFLQHGADPNISRKTDGVTPLYMVRVYMYIRQALRGNTQLHAAPYPRSLLCLVWHPPFPFCG